MATQTTHEVNQRSGVTFGRWKLIPLDCDNWELAHWHVAARGKNAGKEQWNRTGRFYQSNTFRLALTYAADQEAKEGYVDSEGEMLSYLKEYDRILASMTDALLESLGGR